MSMGPDTIDPKPDGRRRSEAREREEEVERGAQTLTGVPLSATHRAEQCAGLGVLAWLRWVALPPCVPVSGGTRPDPGTVTLPLRLHIIYNREGNWMGRTTPRTHTNARAIPEITCVLSACHVRSRRTCIAAGARRSHHSLQMFGNWTQINIQLLQRFE
ncbi:unnamed protein product [Pleuronectes platessa]|uniref:Uncharacterized protein n=1 Tax=Pleuronectes platessa TaxID=8262 RepID=A0A9N7Z9S1_PLEPL|nr:unnamed protein product [Pleuronectes platessa]